MPGEQPRPMQVEANGKPFRVLDLGNGPVVLFCHGFPDTAETWRSQMRAVADAGYRAVALDMRGFGESFAPADAGLYTALHTVGDLVGILEVLRIESAVLVGHDWGAAVAQQAMAMRPDRFRALVSLSIPITPRGHADFYGELRRRGLEDRFYAFAFMKPDAAARFGPAEEAVPSVLYWTSGSPPPGTGWDPMDPSRDMLRPAPVDVPEWADPDYVRRTVAAFSRTGYHTGLNYYRATQATFDLTAPFQDVLIRQPSLYIWGGADGLCQLFHPTPPTVEELRRDAPGLVDAIRLEGVGHWVQHEARDRVNEELVRFLDTLDGHRGTPADPDPSTDQAHLRSS